MSALDPTLSQRDASKDEAQDSENEEGWEDVSPEASEDIFVSLLDTKTFTDMKEMLVYCKDTYNFDIWSIQKQHNLDFLGLVKLVNHVRRRVKNGEDAKEIVNVESNEFLDDDQNLAPALEDDAVLYNLEEVLESGRSKEVNEVEDLREQLAAMTTRFEAYKKDVARYLDEKLENELGGSATSDDQPDVPQRGRGVRTWEDQDYFEGYGFNAIHATMLKDKVRTDAYRDFIYENKDLFEGKTVLDVGCGTGILSMFCAKAGAKQVIAVDNSQVIHSARQIIRANGLDDKIRCIRGKIEEIEMPVSQVDIIVSEWMGYCLLYESMFDSVIYARDKWLVPGGLMVPSHASIKVAPLADSELRISHIGFWQDVYGFDMSAMLEKAFEEAQIRVIDPSDLGGEGVTVKELDLHTLSVKELDFQSPFEMTASKDFDSLDGFAVWFDIVFGRHRDDKTTDMLTRAGAKAFSTSPMAEPTHWQQGALLIQGQLSKFATDQKVTGQVEFKKKEGRLRALDMTFTWTTGDDPLRSQTWLIE